jgi:hypothetical protein
LVNLTSFDKCFLGYGLNVPDPNFEFQKQNLSFLARGFATRLIALTLQAAVPSVDHSIRRIRSIPLGLSLLLHVLSTSIPSSN